MTKLYHDHFQNFKSYGLQKAQLIIDAMALIKERGKYKQLSIFDEPERKEKHKQEVLPL